MQGLAIQYQSSPFVVLNGDYVQEKNMETIEQFL